MTPLSAATGLDELGAERFLTALVRSSDDAIIGKTPDGRVVFWNVAAERLYADEAAEMLGRDIAILFPIDHVISFPRYGAGRKRARWSEIYARSACGRWRGRPRVDHRLARH